MMFRMVAAPVFFITLLLILSGCGRSPSSTYYTLESAHTGTIPSAEVTESLTLGLRQVALPDVLNQPQLVLIDNEQVKMLEFHRWSEPLDAVILRIVASELRSRLNTSSVLSYPWPQVFNPDQLLTISVNRFNGLPGKEVEFSGVWILNRVDGSLPLRTERFHFVEKVDGNDYPALVRAHSGALNQLINQIATVLTAIN